MRSRDQRLRLRIFVITMFPPPHLTSNTMVRLSINVNVNLSISYLRRKTGRGCVALYNYGDVYLFHKMTAGLRMTRRL